MVKKKTERELRENTGCRFADGASEVPSCPFPGGAGISFAACGVTTIRRELERKINAEFFSR